MRTFTRGENDPALCVLRAIFFLSIQQSLVDGEPENAYWIPGTENPADGLTRLRSEMGPIMALLETGIFQPGFFFFCCVRLGG